MIKSTIKLLLLTSIFFSHLSLNTFAMDEDIQEINRRANIIQKKFHEYQQKIQSLEQERDDADKLIDHMISISKFISTDDPLKLNPDINIKKISLTDNIYYSNHNETGIHKNTEMENLLVQSQTRYNMNRKRMPVSPIRIDPQNLTILRPTGQNVQQTTAIPTPQLTLPNISTTAKDCPPKYTSRELTQIQFVTQESALDKMNREYQNNFEANDGAPFKPFDYVDRNGNGHYF